MEMSLGVRCLMLNAPGQAHAYKQTPKRKDLLSLFPACGNLDLTPSPSILHF